MLARKVFILLFVFLSYIPLLAQVDTAWVRTYSGGEATALAVDDSGNVYVTGPGSCRPFYSDYTTIGYSPNGEIIWIRCYDGDGGGNDIPLALIVDKNANVYTTGRSWGGDAFWDDFATVKYEPSGDTLWTKRYNGPANYFDIATALAVDDSGNVYVTGLSVVSGKFNADYTTIKYSANGDTLWLRQYNGPGNGSDRTWACSVDDSGNTYVTGMSWGGDRFAGGTDFDYATIKYSPNGDTLWVRRYNGTGNSEDGAKAIAVDNYGNIYVTGFSTGLGGTGDYDFVTIKYSSAGDTLWVRRFNDLVHWGYDEAQALAVDEDGNVYVTGRGTGTGYLTIKYSPNGDTLWVRRYNIPYDARPAALAVDQEGNVYVTGNSGTIKYLANGDLFWSRTDGIAGNDIALDDSGNVYVAGAIGADYGTIKYVQFVCIAKPGDANVDGVVNLQDLIFKVNYVFKGGEAPSLLCRGDVNADGKVNLTDIIYEVNFIFKGGPAPLKSRECCL